MNISREVAMIPLLSGLAPRYLMFCMAAPEAETRLLKRVKGVAQSGINLADLRTLPVPLPPELEQHAVLESLERRLLTCSALNRGLTSMRLNLDALDQSSLAEAFRGELVPQDPSDEPAEVMLARVRAEAEAASSDDAPKPKRTRKTADGCR
jgi:type I restriction enzyme S subunit